jgi:CHAT domain-containing protein
LQSPPKPSDRSRIWWCPTGPLTFLPLHAAGIYGSAYQQGSCISDFVVSSYIPTVRSLNDKFIASSTSFKCTSLILISQPNTPGLSSIPFTRTETYNLKALMKETTIDVLLLEDSKATKANVKAAMKSHSWAHFACHGVQDVNQPLESGLCLHDGRMELLEIMKEEIPNLDLAFLSACQTSKGDFKLSEEVVHLAAGMLIVGYHGVIGTMWSISDMHGPAFATEFYKYLLKKNQEKGLDELDSTQAAYALDYATKKVRERLGESDTAFLTWVPYVHFGY